MSRITITVYRVVGERKKEYFRRKESSKEKAKKLKAFLKEQFPEFGKELPISGKATFFTQIPKLLVEKSQSQLISKLSGRKDLRVDGVEYWDEKEWIAFVPNRRSKAGKELYEKWKEITDLPEWNSYPEFLQVDAFSLRDFYPPKTRLAKVVEQDGEVILYCWSGFEPENLEGFEPIEVEISMR